MIRLQHLPFLGLGILTACAQPTTQTMYAAYLEPHTWSYHAHREGLGSVYDGRITMQSKPIDARHSKLEVHLLKDANDANSGGVQMYWLDFSSFPPRITNSSSTGGNARLEPGFALPNESVTVGSGQAHYAKTQGILSLKNLAFSWSVFIKGQASSTSIEYSPNTPTIQSLQANPQNHVPTDDTASTTPKNAQQSNVSVTPETL